MGSKERIQRLKDENRINILHAALKIVKEEGWQALSMRRIADMIEYTAPTIYEYFPSKEAILAELSRKGYLMLGRKMKQAKDEHRDPAKQLEAMWLSYWAFAFEEKELYQIMFGVGVNCCMGEKGEEAETALTLVCDSIREIMEDQHPDESLICRKYYTFWSVIHGLISINLVNRGVCDRDNKHILQDAIRGVIRSLRED